MSAQLLTFPYSSSRLGLKDIRVVLKEGEPWFVAKDVAEVLGYGHTPHMIRLLDEDEKGVHIVDTPGGPQEMAVISESGLYHAIFKSRRKEAQRFRQWVTGEVLPAIRKTGRYELSGSASSTPQETWAKALEASILLALEAVKKELAEMMVHSMAILIDAQVVGEEKLEKRLKELRHLLDRVLGRQRKAMDNVIPLPARDERIEALQRKIRERVKGMVAVPVLPGPRKWTAEEDEILVYGREVEKLGWTRIGYLLGRSEGSVKQRWSRLKRQGVLETVRLRLAEEVGHEE